MQEEIMRTAQELKNGNWIDIDPMKIKMGMIFRLFEFDGTLVINNEGKSEFLAISHSYYNEGGIGSVWVDGGNN